MKRSTGADDLVFPETVDLVDELLTTRQVASELQVSESSIKRWCDLGLIETQRTAGGHRRIARSALERFVASHYRTLAKSGGTQVVTEAAEPYRLVSRDDLIQRFQQCLLIGDEAACKDVVDHWVGRFPGIAQLGDLLIATAMETVGRLWECGRAEIYQERRSCEICSQLISELRSRLIEVPVGAPRAIGGTVSGDNYTLANSLVELVLREAGWNATSLGGNLPLETLLVAVRREKPRLLWLSISHIDDTDRFIADYNKFYSQLPANLAVAVGGRALTDQLRPRIGYTAHCDNLEKLSALAKVIAGVR